MLESLSKVWIFEFSHQNSYTKSLRNQQVFVRLFRLFRRNHLFSSQHHEVKYFQRKLFRDLFHQMIRIFRLRHTKLHQSSWKLYQSMIFLFRSQHLYQCFENRFRSFILQSTICFACFVKILDHLVCDSIIIVVFFSKISIFVNLTRSSLISLSKICSKCSMKNSEKRVYCKIKITLFLENSSQVSRELRFISSLQSIRNRRLIRIRKIQNRKVWISTCLRNQFALFSAIICLKNRSNYHTNCQMSFAFTWNFLSKLFFSFSYFFVFFRLFFCFRIRFDYFRCKNELY